MVQRLLAEHGGLRGLLRLAVAELARAGQLLGVELLDHLVVGQGRWASLRRLGLGFPAAT